MLQDKLNKKQINIYGSKKYKNVTVKLEHLFAMKSKMWYFYLFI